MNDGTGPEIEVHAWQQSPQEREAFLQRFLDRQDAIRERRRNDLPTAQQTFAAMTKNEIAPRLRELGFKGSGQKFRIPSETHLLALDFQRSAWNDIVEVRFTINLSAAESDPDTKADEAGSTPRTFVHGERLGFIARGRDHWWGVTADGPTLAVADDVVRDVREFGAPWLRRQTRSNFSVPWLPERLRT